MKHLLLLATFALWSAFATAQTRTVSGTISDAAARHSCLSESYKCLFSVPLNRTTEGIGTIIWRFV